jgi:outer membrane murein-binding lipoprotein Lpp
MCVPTKKKRRMPSDVNQLAARIVALSTTEKKKRRPAPKEART